VDVVVIVSPHAPATGVYRALAGDLSSFGVRGVGVEVPLDENVRDAFGLPLIEAPLDYGVCVPLLMRDWPAPVIAVGVNGGRLPALELDARTALVASVNLSAALSPRAPLTEVAGALDAETAFVSALEEDIGSADPGTLVGSCGGQVLHLFDEAFGGRKARVLAHEAPVGVGYLVAEVV